VKAAVASGVSFNALDHPYWKDAFTSLNMGYQPVSRQTCVETFLPDRYEESRYGLIGLLQRCGPGTLTIMTDSSTSVNSEPIVNYMIASSTNTFMFKTIVGDDDCHTADAISDGVMNTIREIGERKIGFFITDNESVSILFVVLLLVSSSCDHSTINEMRTC